MVDAFQEALGQRLLDISEAIKKLRKDFAQKEDFKKVDAKVLQNKSVISETNKKIRELEINIKTIMKFTNQMKFSSANIEEIKLLHNKQNDIVHDFEMYKKNIDNKINLTYNDLIEVFKKFKLALLTKEKKDIVHLEKIFHQFDSAYKDFKKQTSNYEIKNEHRIMKIKSRMESELKNNFVGFRQEMISEVKKVITKETVDNKKLNNQMTTLKNDVENVIEKFQVTTENYLYNLDREIEIHINHLKKEIKTTDLHAQKHLKILETRFADIKGHLQENIRTQQKEINNLNDGLNKEKLLVNNELKTFKQNFNQEFDYLSANLTNLNDVQIKLSRDEVLHHVDRVSESFNGMANTNYKKLQQDLFHVEAENDKLRSVIKKQDGKFKLLEEKLVKRIINLENKTKKTVNNKKK